MARGGRKKAVFAAREATFECRNRHAARPRALAQRQPFDAAQDERRSFVARKLIEQVARFEEELCVVIVARRDGLGDVAGCDEGEPLFAAARAVVSAQTSRGDAEQPRTERRRLAQLVDRAERASEDVLQEVVEIRLRS